VTSRSKGPHARPGSSKVRKGKGPKAKARPQLMRAQKKCTGQSDMGCLNHNDK
jgi:hypothetical protein